MHFCRGRNEHISFTRAQRLKRPNNEISTHAAIARPEFTFFHQRLSALVCCNGPQLELLFRILSLEGAGRFRAWKGMDVFQEDGAVSKLHFGNASR